MKLKKLKRFNGKKSAYVKRTKR